MYHSACSHAIIYTFQFLTSGVVIVAVAIVCVIAVVVLVAVIIGVSVGIGSQKKVEA